MKFLVTGGAGFIGSHLARELLQLGEVTVLDDLRPGDAWRLHDLLAASRVKFIQGSVLHRNHLPDLCKGMDVIFHLASRDPPKASPEPPFTVHDVNATGTLHVLAAAREAGVKKVIYASTKDVYGQGTGSPRDEAAPVAPLSPYAASKLAGEHYCEVFRHSFGLPTTCLRYFNVYGPAQESRGDRAAVIPAFVTASLRKLPPVIYGDGSQVRDFVAVQDVVKASILALQRDAVGIFNVGTGIGTSIRDLARVVRDLTHNPREPVLEKPRPLDIRDSVAAISRSRDLMGYRPSVHLADGLRETIAWFQKHPP